MVIRIVYPGNTKLHWPGKAMQLCKLCDPSEAGNHPHLFPICFPLTHVPNPQADNAHSHPLLPARGRPQPENAIASNGCCCSPHSRRLPVQNGHVPCLFYRAIQMVPLFLPILLSGNLHMSTRKHAAMNENSGGVFGVPKRMLFVGRKLMK